MNVIKIDKSYTMSLDDAPIGSLFTFADPSSIYIKISHDCFVVVHNDPAQRVMHSIKNWNKSIHLKYINIEEIKYTLK